jgi:hypothetical protein
LQCYDLKYSKTKGGGGGGGKFTFSGSKTTFKSSKTQTKTSCNRSKHYFADVAVLQLITTSTRIPLAYSVRKYRVAYVLSLETIRHPPDRATYAANKRQLASAGKQQEE